MTAQTAQPRQRMLEHRRASWAWDAVMKAREKGSDYANAYGQAARAAPADILMNGLGQTLAFWLAKGKGESQCYELLYQHLSHWLNEEHISNGDLLAWIRGAASSDDYRRATAEAMAALIWLKRFAEAELIHHEPI